MRIILTLTAILLLFPAISLAQRPATKVKAKPAVKKSEKDFPLRAQREVIRRGNAVEEVGGGISAAQIEENIALTVPEDDSWKWYITVIGTAECPACDNLKQDFISNPDLQAWVSVDDPEKSWAHYKVYRWEDKTTHSRFENIKITGFPTILIQPPRNQHFGESSTVVFQKTGYGNKRGGYKNAAKLLSNEMSDVIKKYVKAIQKDEQRKTWGSDKEYEVEDGNMTPLQDFSGSLAKVKKESLVRLIKPLEGGIGQPPFDFDGKPTVDPKYPTHPPRRDIPPEGEEGATAEELRAAIPDADADFILRHVEEGSTIEEAVKEWKRIHPFKPILVAWRWHHYLRIIVEFVIGLFCFMFFVIMVLLCVILFRKQQQVAVKSASQPQPVYYNPQPQATAPVSTTPSIPH